MPLIWCSISSHGYGHAAQVVPVLNELGRRIPRLSVILRTAVPPTFFEGRLEIPWELSRSQQDIGCVQQTPLHIDVAATWAETSKLHADWEQRVEAEARVISSYGPTLVLSNISHLAIAAGAQADIPTIGLCSLSWDLILSRLAEPDDPAQEQLIRQIQASYQKANLHIRPTPGMPFTAFRKVVDVGPIARPVVSDRDRLCSAVGATPHESLVLVGFGGISLDDLPFDALERLPSYRFLVSGPVPGRFLRIRSIMGLDLSFGVILASCDLLVTKPGYSTVVEAVALGKPVLYVRRHNFADEQGLVDYLHRHGRGLELSPEDFEAGRWGPSLDSLRAIPAPSTPPPPPTGAGEAADILTLLL